MSVYSGAVLKV
uniref:Uncharacterized protein n=1 Tax=Anguilla anguilla TaxID=7936 RepID=A0A0E9RXH1_ANGAN